MDLVLGVSMAAPSVHLVLVEGQDADGVTVDEDGFEVDANGAPLPDRVVSAILGTRESALEGGYRLTSTGVTVTDQVQAGQLRDALANRRVDNVMLVSAFLAAAALAQTVGGSVGYRHIALMFIEPDTATLALVDASDGSITDVRRVELPADDTVALARLTTMAAQASGDGMFVVGSGVNVGLVKPELDAASPIPVSVPEEPETALARGAALASAHAPLFDSSTSALAWARDPGTGMIDPSLLALSYAYASSGTSDYEATMGEQALAYSAVDDDDDDYLVFADDATVEAADYPATGAQPSAVDGTGTVSIPQNRKPFLLAGSGLAAFFVFGVSALVVALAVGIRPTADQRPAPIQHIVVPAQQAPAPPPKMQPAVPAPKVQQPSVPAPVAPPPVVQAPVAKPAPVPAAPAPAPAAPAPAPAAPAPAPVAPVPIPIPIPIQIPAPAPIEAPPPIRQPVQVPAAPPKQPAAPKPPSIFNPKPETPPRGHDNGPSWLPGNNGGAHDSAPPNPWAPGNNGGGRGGGNPNPWFPGLGGGGKDSGRGGGGGLFPGWGGGGHGGGGGGLFPGWGGGGGHGGGFHF